MVRQPRSGRHNIWGTGALLLVLASAHPVLARSDPGYDALQAGQYTTAERVLTQQLKDAPNDPFALLNLGVVYERTGRPDQARQMYLRVINMNPTSAVARSTDGTYVNHPLGGLAQQNLDSLNRRYPPRKTPVPLKVAAPKPPPKPTPVPVPVLEPTPPPQVGGIGVQLAAYRSASRTEGGWKILRNKYGDLLGALSPHVREVAIPGKGTFYRLIAGPLGDRGSAKALCRQLIERGKDGCSVKKY